jgi:hypothetical protein
MARGAAAKAGSCEVDVIITYRRVHHASFIEKVSGLCL